MSEPVTIQSTDYWIKVVEMLQQNWALIEAVKPEGVCVYFISDTSGVFDQMSFADEIAAREALVRNGFKRCVDDLRLQSFYGPRRRRFIGLLIPTLHRSPLPADATR
jgi:hypothetical protein